MNISTVLQLFSRIFLQKYLPPLALLADCYIMGWIKPQTFNNSAIQNPKFPSILAIWPEVDRWNILPHVNICMITSSAHIYPCQKSDCVWVTISCPFSLSISCCIGPHTICDSPSWKKWINCTNLSDKTSWIWMKWLNKCIKVKLVLHEKQQRH